MSDETCAHRSATRKTHRASPTRFANDRLEERQGSGTPRVNDTFLSLKVRSMPVYCAEATPRRKQWISENEAPEKGLKKKSAESSQRRRGEMDGSTRGRACGHHSSQWSRSGMRRHRSEATADPAGRECGQRLSQWSRRASSDIDGQAERPIERERMSQFVEKGAEVYAKA
jgi:hypothetical protein